jgi:hypothetical protein
LKASNVVLLGGLGILAYTLLGKKIAAGTLNFFPNSVSGLAFDGATPVMTFAMTAQNTSGQIFTIRSLAGNLYANDYYIGNFSSFTPQAIQPNAASVLYMDVRLSLIGIVQDVIDAFENKHFEQDVIFKGWANVDNYQIPISIKYKIGV